MNISRLPALLTAAVAILALSACGGEDTPQGRQPGVVTLRTGAPGANPSPSAAGRPIIRPDASREEIEALVQAYHSCLNDNGFPQWKNAEGRFDKPPGEVAVAPVDPAAAERATKVCANEEPESWTAVEERNPEYRDLLEDQADCMNDKGMDVALRQDPEGGPWYIAPRDVGPGTAEEQARRSVELSNEEARAKVTRECEQKAFAERIKLYG
ncbi:hypothetical protein ACIA8K_28840 [Catenuloplanes sp. NPDC051500]|uniref:hypothetical protein n=1 Tax=Catenuloplanes sp. NPDC051500 TaxID=3363959 RepID=UPI0037A9F008